MFQLRKFVFVWTVVIALATTTILAAQSKTQSPSAEQQLIQIERDWCAAALKHDGAALGRILADDYTGVTSRGLVETKAQSIASATDKSSTLSVCVDNNMKARVYGDAAVVTGEGTRTGTYKGAAFTDRKFVWVDTFIKKDGRWQCVASGGAVIAAQQK